MIAINKSEKEAIVSRFPHAHVVRTMKKKSKRHHYYCEETPEVVRYLKTIRGEVKQIVNKKGDGRYKSRKNA